MRKNRKLLALVGIVVLLLGLSGAIMQCAPAAEEEVTPPPEEEVTPPPEEEVTPAPGEIEYGGRLTVGWLEGMENLIMDSKQVYTSWGCLFTQLTYDFLWFQGWPENNYDPVPILATSWETEDGKTWTFHLRENATFHDGTPVTAEDVAFTYWHLVNAEVSWQYPRTLCESYPRVIDDHTVEITLAETVGGRYPGGAWMPILPKHIWEPYKDSMLSFSNDEAIGSGPFKLKEFKNGEYMWYVVNESYYGATHKGRPYLDEVVWKLYGSRDALYAALKSGEIDCIGEVGVSPLVADDFRNLEHLDVVTSPGLSYVWLTFNLHKDTSLQDLTVREAIMHGIDRDKCIDMLYLGYAEKIDSLVYSELQGHNPNLPQYNYDPDLARELLDNGGYADTDGDGIRNDPVTGDNLAFDLLSSTSAPDNVKASMLVKEQLGDIGIEVTPMSVDYSTFTSVIYDVEEDLYDIAFSGETPGTNSDWAWYHIVSPEGGGGAWNTAYYNNPEFDDLYFKMVAERDPDKRIEYLYRMQLVVQEDLPYGFLWRPQRIDPVNNRFEGYVFMMGGVSPWCNPWTYEEVHLK